MLDGWQKIWGKNGAAENLLNEVSSGAAEVAPVSEEYHL